MIKDLLEKMGGPFWVSLGINLDKRDSQEVFKWFLASILYAARISETTAFSANREFASREGQP